MKLSLLCFVFFLPLLGACSQLVQKNPQQTNSPYQIKRVETLGKIQIEDKHLKISVISTGCTRADDFIIESQLSDQQCQLTVYRIKPDLCKRAPQTMNIRLTWDKNSQCGDLPVNYTNHVTGNSPEEI